VLAARNELELVGELRSDVAPINGLVRAALDAVGEDLVAMKDPTRGGVASALSEMATKSGVGVVLEQSAIPISDGVHAASELLGIDPLHVANEGKALMVVKERSLARLLAVLHEQPLGAQAAAIGVCVQERVGCIVLDTGFGRRLLTELDGEPLPRIC
jgi:hydrogenase expression/formation protein HypE